MPYESLAGADRRHRFTLSAIYQMPFGKRGRVQRMVIGGWQLPSVYIYQSGVALTWGDAVFFGNGTDIARGPHTPEQWFNIDAGFTRNTATRPASYHYRTWPFRFANLRGRDVQLRGEGLNAFNRVQFAGPNTDQFSTAFGQITGAANYPRQIQAVLRVNF
jgi:hypothetical protein